LRKHNDLPRCVDYNPNAQLFHGRSVASLLQNKPPRGGSNANDIGFTLMLRRECQFNVMRVLPRAAILVRLLVLARGR
jgi:hypothetical protein